MDNGMAEGRTVARVRPRGEVGAAGVSTATHGVEDAGRIYDVGHSIAKTGFGIPDLVGQRIVEFDLSRSH